MKKYFSAGLYVETLKRLRRVGLTLGAITWALSVFVLLLLYSVYGPENLRAPDIGEVAPFLSIYMYIGPVALVLTAFSWLTRRADSDFYHGLPQSRLCVYFSMVAAVLTYAAGTIAGVLLCVWAGYALVGVPFIALSVPVLALHYFAACVLCAGCVLVAVGVSGTMFSNCVLTALIMFLPRLALLCVTFIVSQMVPMSGPSEMGIFLYPASNILTGGIITPLGFNEALLSPSIGTLLSKAGPFFYTLAAGIGYIALGAYLFKKRPSEMAGSNAPTPLLQHIYRCGITAPFVLLAATNAAIRQNGSAGVAGGVIPTLMVLSVLVYGVYEFYTARSFKGIWRSLVVYPVVVAACACLALGAVGFGRARLNDIPSPREVVGVRLRTAAQNGEQNYNAALTQNLLFTDAQFVSLALDALANTVAQQKSQGLAGQYGYAMDVDIVCKNRTLSRSLSLTKAQYDEATAYLSRNRDYQAALCALPDEEDIYAIYVDKNLTPGQARALYDTYKAERATMGAGALEELLEGFRYQAYVGQHDTKTEQCLGYITLYSTMGLNGYTTRYAITAATPQTARAYAGLINAAGAEDAAWVEELLDTPQSRWQWAYVLVDFFAGEGEEQGISLYWYAADAQQKDGIDAQALRAFAKDVMERIKSGGQEEIFSGECLARVQIELCVAGEEGQESRAMVMWLAAGRETMDEWSRAAAALQE